MADNDEAGDEAAHVYFNYLAIQEMGMATDANADGANGTDTDATHTGTEAETATDGTSQASEGKKGKRTRRPNQLGTGRLVITEVAKGDFEPIEPRDVAAKYGNQ